MYRLIGGRQPFTSVGYDAACHFHSVETAIEYCMKCIKRDQLAPRRIIRPPSNVESPDFTLESVPTLYTATTDMASSTASGRHLSKFENNYRKCRLLRFGTNFSDAAFCLPHQLVGFLLSYLYGPKACASDHACVQPG